MNDVSFYQMAQRYGNPENGLGENSMTATLVGARCGPLTSWSVGIMFMV